MRSSLPSDLLTFDPPILTLNISAADNGVPSLSVAQTINIFITDIPLVNNQQLPIIILNNVKIKENDNSGKIVGMLYNSNLTIEDNIIFELLENPDNLFEITDNKYLKLVKNLTDVDGDSREIKIQVRNIDTFEVDSKDIVVFIIPIDKCLLSDNTTCHEKARCVSLNSTHFHCQCELGYVGDGYDCVNKNDCDIISNITVESRNVTNPCKNNANCVDGLNRFSCQCQQGYSGKLCEIQDNQENPCLNVECRNFGICEPDVHGLGGYTCKCETGWSGDMCQENVNDCISPQCFGEGVCVDKINNYVCNCSQERQGSWCQYMKDACGLTTCESDTEICVPYINKAQSICANRALDLVAIIIENKMAYDAEQIQADIVTTIQDYFKRSGNQPLARKKRSTNKNEDPSLELSRTKRAVAENDKVQVYLVTLSNHSNGGVAVEFVVMDTASDVYTKEEVLNFLSKTCNDLGMFVTSKCTIFHMYVPSNQLQAIYIYIQSDVGWAEMIPPGKHLSIVVLWR